MAAEGRSESVSRSFRVILALICFPGGLFLGLLAIAENEFALWWGAALMWAAGLCAVLPARWSRGIANVLALVVATTSVWLLVQSLAAGPAGIAGALQLFIWLGIPAFLYLFWRINPFADR